MHFRFQTRPERLSIDDYVLRLPVCEYEVCLPVIDEMTIQRIINVSAHRNDQDFVSTSVNLCGTQDYQETVVSELPNNFEQKSIGQYFHVDVFDAPAKDQSLE